MVVVKMQGRFGNQLFVYALGLALERRLGCHVLYDCLSPDVGLASTPRRLLYWTKVQLGRGGCPVDLSAMRIRLSRVSVADVALRRFTRIGESDYATLCDGELRALAARGNLYFDGFWQSESYFSDVASEVKAAFSFRRRLNDRAASLLENIRGGASVAVHVRRGDYVQNPLTAAAHNVCDLDYYERAVDCMAARVSNPKLYVFSDDMPWCRDHLRVPPSNTEFIDTTALRIPHLDFELMMNCRHFVIANSSYSWWAAYLGKFPDKIVIAPAVWNRASANLRPQCEGWFRLPVQ